jgi:hypothetical protein
LAATLIKANPQLSNLSKVSPGSVIALPDAAPPLNPGQGVSLQTSRRAAIAAQALPSLASLDQQFIQATSRVVDAANVLQSIAQSQQTKDLAGTNSDLKQQLPNLIASLQATAKQTSTTQDANNKTLNTLLTRLQALGI